MNAILQALLYSLAPVAGMIVGGLAAAWKPPSQRVRSYIQHFASGIVFAAIAVEILPKIVKEHDPLAAAVGFAIGVAAMLVIRLLGRSAESGDQPATANRTPWAFLVAIAIDILVDGLLVGVGFALGERQGVLLALALTGCTISIGLATAATLLRFEFSRQRAAVVTAGLGLFTTVGAVIGAIAATQLSGVWMEGILSFTCAALLYLVTEELLVEAHEEEKVESAFATALFFVGFLALMMMELLVE